MYNNFFSILLEKLLFYRYKDAERRYMRIDIPEGANKVIEGLEAAGYEAYIVGGCVRDSILGREPGDWDITTSARPEQVKEIFRRTVDTGIEHGTVTVMMGKEGYEVTTYTGKNRVNASVFAATAEARRENAAHNSILKAVGGG